MTDHGVEFETAAEAEYPWAMCRAYTSAVIADLKDLMVPPIGTAVVDLKHLLYNQIMGSTRASKRGPGLQAGHRSGEMGPQDG